MASYPVTVYRSDDPGAPQLDNGKISSFFNILQKCLVEGYGDKTPLGWTRSLYDPTTFKAAWRNDVSAGGSGGSAYFYSNTGTDVNNTIIRLTSCKSIRGGGEVVNQGRLTAMTIPSVMTRWVLIGTTIGFYFYVFGATVSANGNGLINNGELRAAFYMGDIFSIIPTDAGRFISFHEVSSVGHNTFPQSARTLLNISNNAYYKDGSIHIWDADNFNSSSTYGYSSIAIQAPGSGAISTANPHPLTFSNVSVILTQPGLNFDSPNQSNQLDRVGVPYQNSLIRPVFRGVIPGMLISYFSFGYGEQVPLVKTYNSVDHHVLPNRNAIGSACLIQASGEWDDPFK